MELSIVWSVIDEILCIWKPGTDPCALPQQEARHGERNGLTGRIHAPSMLTDSVANLIEHSISLTCDRHRLPVHVL